MRIAHLSDPHFGTDTAAVRDALTAWLDAQRPDALVLSGDVTQRATCAQFAAARAFLDTLRPVPLLAVPGNHDIPLHHVALRAFAPYRRWQSCFAGPLESELDLPDALVIGTNTTRRWLHKDGRIGGGQIARVADRLRAAQPGQLRVVVVHQPIAVIRPKDTRDLLRNREAALAAWGEAGCDLVLGGHIHLPYVRALPTAATAGRPLYVVQAGTALSTRTRTGVPNSVNLLCTEPGSPRRCRVERHDLLAGTFTEVERHQLDLGPV